jgi:hypothetical protein
MVVVTEEVEVTAEVAMVAVSVTKKTAKASILTMIPKELAASFEALRHKLRLG